MSAGRGRVLMRVLAHLIRQEATLATTPAGRADEGAVRRARNVRRALESLGPFYVKVGQMLATRPDIVTPQMIDEFEKLQDEASPPRSATSSRCSAGSWGRDGPGGSAISTPSTLWAPRPWPRCTGLNCRTGGRSR